MEKKTIEEMKAAIKDYCRETCPNIGSVIMEPKHIHVKKYDDEEWCILFPYAVGWVGVSSMGEGDATFLYAALGLAERDADSHWRGVLSEMARTKEEYIGELQARNAALVAALEEIGVFATDEDGEEMDAFDMGQTIGEMVDDAIAANKKAIEVNTEKGGANG